VRVRACVCVCVCVCMYVYWCPPRNDRAENLYNFQNGVEVMSTLSAGAVDAAAAEQPSRARRILVVVL
jgi:hypothetical protein